MLSIANIRLRKPLAGGLVLLLATAVAADAHERSPQHVEAAALGAGHAADHAAQERALQRWAQLPPAERQRRARAQERASTAFVRSLALPAPEVVGAWGPPATLPGYAINMVLLPTGKILYWDRAPIPAGGGERPNTSRAYLWDPATPAAAPEDVTPPPLDFDRDGDDDNVPIFCSGQSLLPTGEVFMAGGTLDVERPGQTFKGARFALTFDPWTRKWTRQPDMQEGRWYPGQGQLADGRIVVLSGLDESGTGSMNADLEVFTPSPVRGGVGSWRRYDLSNVDWGADTPGFYPHLLTLPSGKLLMLGPNQTDVALLDPALLESGATAWTQLPDLSDWHPTGSAVLLPGGPSGSSRAAIVGGYSGNALPRHSIDTAETADITNPASLSWITDASRVPDLNVARSNANLVQLPDGGMVMVGGAAGVSADEGQNWVGTPEQQELKQIELYRPGATQWELGPAQQKFRSYHSTAVLLPDGRVLSAGDDYWTFTTTDEADPELGTDTAEAYSPPYLFAGARPQITAAPAALQWGDAFRVQTAGPPATRAVLMAPGATTHGNDMNQRHVELQVTAADAAGLSLAAPPGPAVAPPGWYMLFVLDAAGTPSVATWIQLATRPPAPPPGPAAADERAPRLSLSLRRPARRGGRARLRVRLDERGTVRVYARAAGKRTRRSLSITKAGRVRNVAVALPRRTRARVVIRAVGRDLAGNRVERRIARTLKRLRAR